MTRACIALLGLSAVALGLHVAEAANLHEAWLVFLGVMVGIAIGVLISFELTAMAERHRQ